MTTTADHVLKTLESYGLKPDGTAPGGGQKYRCNSPLRTGSNSMAFTITITDGEHGAFYDHVSDEKGSLYDLAQRLGIEPDRERAPVGNTKRAYSGLDDYAAAHGVPGDVFRAARWREVSKNDRLALEFPTRSGPRWRFLDGNKPVFVSPPGYQRCWYGLNAPLFKALADGQHPLVICNGEPSVVVAQHYGLAALAMTGSGENLIPPDLLDDLLDGLKDLRPPVIVALDCDAKGRRVAPQIARQFQSRGFQARAVDLALGEHGDLADFCMLHGADTGAALLKLQTLVADAAQTQIDARSWVIVHARDLKNLPPMTWLIPGEIPEKGLTVIYGPAGAGKSFLALDYALTLAQAKTVVYVAAEGQGGYHQRVAAWCKHNGKNEGNLYLCLGSPNLMAQEDLAQFIAAIAALSPVMVIVDTLAMAMIGGDENSARDMGLIIRACQTIQHEIDGAVVLVHHTNKGGTIERGSSALRGACDSMIRVTGDDDVIVIESTKTKDAAPFEPRYMKLLPVQNDDGTESRVMIPASRIVQSTSDPLTPNQLKLLRAMSLEVFRAGATFTDLAEATDLGRGAIQRTMSRLLKLGYVNQPQTGGSYAITDAGRARVESSESPDSAARSYQICLTT